MNAGDWIQEAARAQVARNQDAIEAACESMLTTPGDYGVLVTHLADCTVRAELTHDVPFGEVHHRPEQLP